MFWIQNLWFAMMANLRLITSSPLKITQNTTTCSWSCQIQILVFLLNLGIVNNY
jgi:hypothetical protein